MSRRNIFILIVLIVLFGGLAYYAISPLFRNKEVQDALPEQTVKTIPVSLDTIDSVPADLENEIEIVNDERVEKPIAPAEDDSVEPTDEGGKELISEPPQEEVTTPVSVPAPVETKSVPVIGTFGHPAEGVARVIETAEGTIVRFENFKTINGPNLHVYLSKDLDAKDFVDLGPIRGTSGNINYAVPGDIDISEYTYVLHWCVPFHVLFNSAEIN